MAPHLVPGKSSNLGANWIFLFREISESFNKRSSPPEAPEEAASDILTHDPDAMPLADKMSGWFERIEENENDDNEQQIEEQGDDDPDNASALQFYKNSIFTTPAYQWFLANLRRELYLEPATKTGIETVADVIRRRVSSLPSVRSLSRTKPPETCTMAFEIDWNPLAFVREQDYPQEPHEAIETTITLTGGARDAQALTSGQYLCQTWPINGEHTMKLVKDVVLGLPGSRHSCMSLLLRIYMVYLLLTISLQAIGPMVLHLSPGCTPINSLLRLQEQFFLL